jgi:hypothetical protein
VDGVPLVPILVYGGITLGLGGALLAVLARTQGLEQWRPAIARVARPVGYAGLALLVIVSVLFGLSMIGGLIQP